MQSLLSGFVTVTGMLAFITPGRKTNGDVLARLK